MPPTIDLIACTKADNDPITSDNPWRFCDGLKAGFVGAADRQQNPSTDYPGTFLQRAVGGRIWLDRLCGLWSTPPIVGTGINGQPGCSSMRPPIYMDGIVDFVAPLVAAARHTLGDAAVVVGYFGSWPQGTSILQMRNAIHWLSLAGFTHIGGDLSGGLPSSHLQWSQWVPRVIDAGMRYISEPTMPRIRATGHSDRFDRCRLWDAAVCNDQSMQGPGDGGGENFAIVQLSSGATAADRIAVAQTASAAGWTPAIDPAGLSASQRQSISLANPVAVTIPPPPVPAS